MQRAIRCRIFTPAALPECPAASLRDYSSGVLTGVSRDISEHYLAHMIRGVEGTYDRYDYLAEKREAFDRLAALVQRIVDPLRMWCRSDPAGAVGRSDNPGGAPAPPVPTRDKAVSRCPDPGVQRRGLRPPSDSRGCL